MLVINSDLVLYTIRFCTSPFDYFSSLVHRISGLLGFIFFKHDFYAQLCLLPSQRSFCWLESLCVRKCKEKMKDSPKETNVTFKSLFKNILNHLKGLSESFWKSFVY